MAHPRMYDEADPLLLALRPVALAFPEAVEKESHGRPTFRAGKVFAVYGVTQDLPHALVVERELLDASYRQVANARMLRALASARCSE